MKSKELKSNDLKPKKLQNGQTITADHLKKLSDYYNSIPKKGDISDNNTNREINSVLKGKSPCVNKYNSCIKYIEVELKTQHIAAIDVEIAKHKKEIEEELRNIENSKAEIQLKSSKIHELEKSKIDLEK